MAALSNILHYITPTNVVASLHLRQHRRITVRHVLLTLGIAAVLSTLYYTYLRRDEMFFASSDEFFWPPETPQIWAERAAQVKEAFRHAYRGYEHHAFPHDELLPMSNKNIDNFNGWGVTSVDSLDTMLLMGLEDEYKRALPIITHANFSLPSNTHVPFFETVIRYLGGLLAAYAISGHDLLREKADELGSILAPAFNTTSGFPGFAVDTYSGRNSTYSSGVLAEIASCQMEYAYLGKITGKKEHVDHATLITNLLYAANLSASGGMYPTRWNLVTGAPSNLQLSVGALADSGHEYTLKQFLMTARTDKRNLEMYLKFTSYAINNLLFLTPERNLLYVTDATMWRHGLAPSHFFQHLACFFPGLLALGVHLLPLNNLDALGINVTALADDLLPTDRWAYANLAEFDLADLHLWAAEGIAQTCYLTYADQPTGLGPEIVQMDVGPKGAIRWIDAMRAWKFGEGVQGGGRTGEGQRSGRGRGRLPPGVRDISSWTTPLYENVTVERLIPPVRSKGKRPNTFGRDYVIRNTAYYLRPETIESLYILWRTTGDVKWRHRGWHIFRAIERYAKTYSGYTSVEYVHTEHPTRIDSMPSYFLAETLKYLYLLFSDEDPLPLEKWVFNTEAHALPVFEWSMEEREAYGIV
ncbi:glycoside hydrolase family 47 protein [Butyriboletus roseoflavus]|nr:glycoside hydrolase family 47 protein [Butyriboletus roseoflavus]